jgi:hypothetical protein
MSDLRAELRDLVRDALVEGYCMAKRHSADKLDQMAEKSGGDAALTYLAAAFRMEAIAAETSATFARPEQTSQCGPPTSSADPPPADSPPTGR